MIELLPIGLAVHCPHSEPIRSQYLLQTLHSLIASNTPAERVSLFFSGGTDCIWSYGIASAWQGHAIYETDASSYLEQFEAMHWRYEGKPFIFCEADAIFAPNWYAKAMQAIAWLEHNKQAWSVIGLYSADNINNVQATSNANLLRKGNGCYYGTCAVAFNQDVVPIVAKHARDNNMPFDLAIADVYGQKGELFVHKPSLAQHIGKYSSLNTNWHEAGDFLDLA